MKNIISPLPSSSGSLAVLVFFTIFFVGLCWYVYRRDRKNIYQHLESLPLQEEERI